MKNSQLYRLFQSLNKYEIKALQKFVHSPFFNQREDVKKLLEILIEKDEKGSTIDKEMVFEKVYPNKDFDAQQIRLLMSWLHQLIEQFLVVHDFVKNEMKMKLQLAGIYRKRNLDKHFQKNKLAIERLQKKSFVQNASYYENALQLEMENYRLSSIQKRVAPQNLQKISNLLDTTFIINKLRQTCITLSHKAVYQTKYRIGLLPEVLKHIKDENLLEISVIAVYYYCYLAMVEPAQEDYFFKFRNLLFHDYEKFPKEELGDLYLLAINYCIKQVNNGNLDFAKKALELYKKGLDNKVLLNNGVLSRFTYRNIVALGLKIGEFEWTEQFLKDYQVFLEKKFRKHSYHFNLAKLEFQRQNYHKALLLLHTTRYKDLLLEIAAKTLIAKIYYETQEWNALTAHLESMKIFIRRKKIIAYHHTNYLNFVQLTQKLVNLNFYDNNAIVKLRSEIEATEILTEKPWLLRMIA